MITTSFPFDYLKNCTVHRTTCKNKIYNPNTGGQKLSSCIFGKTIEILQYLNAVPTGKKVIALVEEIPTHPNLGLLTNITTHGMSITTEFYAFDTYHGESQQTHRQGGSIGVDSPAICTMRTSGGYIGVSWNCSITYEWAVDQEPIVWNPPDGRRISYGTGLYVMNYPDGISHSTNTGIFVSDNISLSNSCNIPVGPNMYLTNTDSYIVYLYTFIHHPETSTPGLLKIKVDYSNVNFYDCEGISYGPSGSAIIVPMGIVTSYL